MTIRTDIHINASPYNNVVALQSAIGAYADEAYTNAKKLSGTGIVGSNPEIDPNTETYIGQVRWKKPLNPTINIASLTDPTDGTKSFSTADYLNYIKTVRTHGAEKVNMASVVTQEDGLAKFGRDFAETRGQDEHNAILSVLKGVAISELLYGAGTASGDAGYGGQSFNNDPTSKRYGFYVDLGSATPVVAATAAVQGAARAEGFLQAFGAAYKDYEPDYAYLITSPEVYGSLRSANLVDEDRVQDGNISFSTIFSGKFRILQTRASQGITTAEHAKIVAAGGLDLVGTKTSYIVLPGAIAMANLNVPDDVEIFRNADSYMGGGTTSIWYRWGYVLVPAGYNWAGSQDAFPADADYFKVVDTTVKTLVGATNGLSGVIGTWTRKASSVLSLGILPVFHS